MTVGSDVKSCYMTIKRAEASLQALAASSTSTTKKAVYEEGRQSLQVIKNDLHEQVLFLAREEPQYK